MSEAMESQRGLADAHLPAEMRLVRIQESLVQRGFVRVRAFGFLANCNRQENLALIHRLLEVPPPATDSSAADPTPTPQPARCPHCGQPALYTVRRTSRPTVPELIARTYGPQPFDTS